MVLLELSAGFDSIDHSILLEKLRHWLGISGSALDWFSSCLSNGCFAVAVGDCISSSVPLTFGVPQGLILGPILFSLYMLNIQQLPTAKC